MYIKKIMLRDDYRCLKKDLAIDVRNITLLVGNQGSGKSSLLSLLSKTSKEPSSKGIVDVSLDEKTLKCGIDCFYFDTEKDNPRIKDPQLFTTTDGQNKGIGFAVAVSSRFKSHGEILQNFTVEAIPKAKNCIVLLDEPESALSVHNQFRLAKCIKQASHQNNVQFIIATHCILLIQSVSEVYSMDRLAWLDSNEFIDSQKVD